jgi:hypothetical protein
MQDALTFGELFPSPYLKTADIGEVDKIYTIARIEVEEIGLDKDRKPVIYFTETDKKLVLNKTNAGIISDLYGPRIADWVGKRVGLYTTEVAYQGKAQLGIRVRMRVPPGSKPPMESPPENPPDLYEA